MITGLSPTPLWLVSLQKEEIWTHTEGRPDEHTRMLPVSQAAPAVTNSYETGSLFPLDPRGTNPGNDKSVLSRTLKASFDFGLPASRLTMKQSVPVVEAIQCVVLC